MREKYSFFVRLFVFFIFFNVSLAANATSVGFVSDRSEVNEGSRSIDIRLGINNIVDGKYTINYLIQSGSALEGKDYIGRGGVVVVSGQQGRGIISIPIKDDLGVEGDENFLVSLQGCSVVKKPVPPVATGTVFGGQQPTTVPLTSEGIPIPEANVFGGGTAEVLCNISQGSHNVVIKDNDVKKKGVLEVENTSFSLKEGEVARITVTRKGGSDGRKVLEYITENGSAQAGEDYRLTKGTLIWEAGESGPKHINISTNVDTKVESSETFRVTFKGKEGGIIVPSPVTMTIIEDKIIVDSRTNNICEGAVGELLDRCKEMGGKITDEELRQLLPTEVGSMGIAGVSLGTMQINNLMQRLSSLRQGHKGFSIDGLSVDIQGKSIPTGKIISSLSKQLGGGASSDVLENEKFGFFVNGKVSVGDRDRTNSDGFEHESQGVTVGMDYRLNESLVVGSAFGYSHENMRYDLSAGEMDTNSILAAFYGSYYLPQSFYMDWMLSYGFYDYEKDRNIHFKSTKYVASSETDADHYSAAINLGKNFNWQQWQLNSYARFEYQLLDIESYRESGGGGFTLNVGEQSVNSFMSTLGGQVSYSWSQPWGILLPAVRFEWEHEYLGGSRNIDAVLLNNSNANSKRQISSIVTDKEDRNYFNVGGSLSAVFGGGRTVFVMYESRLGQNNFSNHTVEIGVRIPF